MPKKEIMIQNIASVTVITFLSRKVTETLEIESFRQDLQGLVDSAPNKIFLLDFSEVYFLSSSVIGQLISFSKKAKEINGTVAFCCLKPTVLEIFSLTNLDRIFPFYKSQKEALEELNAGHKKTGFRFF